MIRRWICFVAVVMPLFLFAMYIWRGLSITERRAVVLLVLRHMYMVNEAKAENKAKAETHVIQSGPMKGLMVH